jgi:hypothetical protein
VDEAVLFSRDGAVLVPGAAAGSPWGRDRVHGGAVAALLAGSLERAEWSLTRVAVDLLAPVPFRPLRLELTQPEGGRRVTRQVATLFDNERAVARAAGVSIRQTQLDLPETSREPAGPFADCPVPALDLPMSRVAESVGFESFDSLAVALKRFKSDQLPVGAAGMWLRLLVPVIAGEQNTAVQQAAAAADFGVTSMPAKVPYHQWSFMNTDLTLHLAREPVGSWIGLVSQSLVEPVGAGLGLTTLYDEQGKVGQSAQALIVEARAT